MSSVCDFVINMFNKSKGVGISVYQGETILTRLQCQQLQSQKEDDAMHNPVKYEL